MILELPKLYFSCCPLYSEDALAGRVLLGQQATSLSQPVLNVPGGGRHSIERGAEDRGTFSPGTSDIPNQFNKRPVGDISRCFLETPRG